MALGYFPPATSRLLATSRVFERATSLQAGFLNALQVKTLVWRHFNKGLRKWHVAAAGACSHDPSKWLAIQASKSAQRGTLLDGDRV